MIPNIKFIELLILAGLNHYRITKICEKWHLICISDNEFKKISATLSSDKILFQQIKENEVKVDNQEALVLHENVKKKLQHPDICEKFINGISRYILYNDVNEIEIPEIISIILFHYNLRKFIELGILAGLNFSELNHAWIILNATGILEESFDLFCHFFWDISNLKISIFDEKIEESKLNFYYDDHLVILSEDKNYFLASYGLQDIAFYIKKMNFLYFQINSQLPSNHYQQAEYLKLQTTMSKLINNLPKIPNQIGERNFFSEVKPKVNSAAAAICDFNHSYYYMKHYGIMVDEK